MRAPTRPGGRPRRPGPLAEIRATGTRRRRMVERRAPDPGPRAAWAFAVVALVMGVGFIVVIAFGGTDPRTAAAPSAAPAGTATLAPATPGAIPTGALAVTGNGAGVLPTVSPSPAPTTGPTRSTGAPTALRVEFPQDGEVVVSAHINVFGHAPGGARVVRELADGSLTHTVARPDGLWILGVDLELGTNTLRFRVDGDPGTPLVVRVTHQPR